MALYELKLKGIEITYLNLKPGSGVLTLRLKKPHMNNKNSNLKIRLTATDDADHYNFEVEMVHLDRFANPVTIKQDSLHEFICYYADMLWDSPENIV